MSVDQKASADILQIVANLPDFLRKPIIVKKLDEFFSLDDPGKNETISMILRGLFNRIKKVISIDKSMATDFNRIRE